MENELQILNSVAENPNVTQRQIAQKTGMSLGNVNILIKRLVSKGYLKIEGFGPRTIRYVLTPEGSKYKAELIYNHVILSYKCITDVNLKIDKILEAYGEKTGKRLILLGDRDEVYHTLVNKLNQTKTEYQAFHTVEVIVKAIHKDTDVCCQVLTWQPAYADGLNARGIQFMNVLDDF